MLTKKNMTVKMDNWLVLIHFSLKSLDLVTMKKLDSKVNIIPVIAKADTITKNELHKFKIKVSWREWLTCFSSKNQMKTMLGVKHLARCTGFYTQHP